MPVFLPSPIEFDEVYDRIVLGGIRSPGFVTITGHQRKINWDVKAAKGLAGASTTLKDIPPIEFTCEFYLADAEDYEQWPEFLELINSTVAGPTPKALDIYHPDLVEQGIKSVVKASTEGTKHDGKGGAIKVVKFQEYFPPKKAKGNGGVNSSASKKKKDDPNADLKAELNALVNQYQGTSPWEKTRNPG